MWRRRGGSEGGTQVTDSGQARWKAMASVISDSCAERIANVEQTFLIDGSSVDTGIVVVPRTNTESGFSFGFSETNGDCERSYLGEFTEVTGSTAKISLTSTSRCASKNCESKWSGTAALVE